jgi:hypothetical protein
MAAGDPGDIGDPVASPVARITGARYVMINATHLTEVAQVHECKDRNPSEISIGAGPGGP